MKIIADEEITYVREVFSSLGEITTIPASQIIPQNIKEFDVLLVRSVVKVNSNLLKNTRIKFVGSVTSGIDHIDRNYLRKNGIKLVYAPGCNANSVAEYVLAALIILSQKKNFCMDKKTIGIIGVGNVGKRVARICTCLGIKFLLNDPPKFNRTKDKKFISLINPKEADIITLHVPLTFTGKYKTYHMVDEEFLKKLNPGTILINTARGSVIDEKALLRFTGKLGGLILDVWENEPNINTDLLKVADIATPHIAGYSIEGKLRGTMMVYKRLCQLLNRKERISVSQILSPAKIKVTVKDGYRNRWEVLSEAIFKAYNPLNDDRIMRKILKIDQTKISTLFESLRRNYPVRHEFGSHQVKLEPPNPAVELLNVLKCLGFDVIY